MKLFWDFVSWSESRIFQKISKEVCDLLRFVGGVERQDGGVVMRREVLHVEHVSHKVNNWKKRNMKLFYLENKKQTIYWCFL